MVEREAAVGAARDDEAAPDAKHWRFVRPPKTKRWVDVWLTPRRNEGGNEQQRQLVTMRVDFRELEGNLGP